MKKNTNDNFAKEEFSDSDIQEWFESEEEEEVKATKKEDIPSIDISERFSSSQLRIVRSSMDFSLHNLRQSLKDVNYLNLSPEYQRRHRWDIKKKSLLIESFLMNIPVPPVFLYENSYNQYEVMDGRQRLGAIDEYLNNAFPLKGLEYWKELNGFRFNELPVIIQKGLLRRTLSAIVLLAETAKPEESDVDVRMALFKRLNAGGISLNAQELRNALYPSQFNDLLIELSRWDLFREIWGIPKYTQDELHNPPKELINNTLYKNFADCGIVLRYFAIKELLVNSVGGPLRKIMDCTMIMHRNDTKIDIDKLREEYKINLQYLYDIFDRFPFRLPKVKRASRPLYDALMVALSILPKSELGNKGQIQNNLSTALNDKDKYEVLIGRGNTTDSIKERVYLAKSILQR